MLHTVIGILFIALVFGHIFLAVFFVPGTLQGMVSGKVDANWANNIMIAGTLKCRQAAIESNRVSDVISNRISQGAGSKASWHFV